jgi:hypothetical protein
MDDEGSVRGEDSGASSSGTFLLSVESFPRENPGLLKKSAMDRIMGRTKKE